MKKQRLGNNKTVQREEWTKPDLVTITYMDGTKEQMTRKVFDQMIREVK